MNSYFKNYTNRLFFLYGQTRDEFYQSSLKVSNLKEILHQHLVRVGYERILFYQGEAMGARCYDRRSFELTFSGESINSREKKSNSSKSNNRVLKGVLGKRIAKRNSPDSAKYDDKDENLTKRLRDADIVTHFNFLMQDKNIKTAIIFSDFSDFLNHTNREIVRNLSANMREWEDLPSTNQNIVIFINSSNISIEQIIENSRNYPHWQFLTSKMFRDEQINPNHMFGVELPHRDEIINLLNYLRLVENLDVEWLEWDNIIDILLKVSRESDLNLKAVSAKLRELKEINLKDINTLFKVKNEPKGFEKLKTMRGLDYLQDELEKLVKYATKNIKNSVDLNTKEPKRLLPKEKTKVEANIHIALMGNPGTGKTTIARIISEIFKDSGVLEIGHMIEAKESDLVGQYVGATAIKTQEKIDQAIGGVLFIDEAYKLLNNNFGQEAINTITEAMTARAGEFAVVIAGYPKEIEDFLNANPGLQRRFANKVTLKDYEPEVLIEIFKDKMAKESFSFDEELEEIFPHLIKNWFDARDEKSFGNAGDVINLFEKMAKNAFFDDRDVLTLKEIPQEYREFARKISSDSMEETLKKLDNIIGLESVKENIKSIINSIKVEKLRNPNSQVIAGHYVFKGNPGTGKTTVARIFGEILKDLKVLKKGHFIEATREDLVAGYVAQTAPKTREILEKALGGVLFIDEAYSLSQGGENDFGQEAIDTIVPFMENHLGDFTLIVAGYDEDMDRFLEANIGLKSRFTNTIHFEDYSKDELFEIFMIFAKKEKYKLEDGCKEMLLDIFERIRNQKHFGNGRDVRKIFNTIKRNLNNRVVSIQDLKPEDERLFIITKEDIKNI